MNSAQWAHELMQAPFLVVDTETTGLDGDAEIVQIAVINEKGRPVFASLIKPELPIDEEGGAFAVNGITNQMVSRAPGFRRVYDILVDILHRHTVIAYNSNFDERILRQVCERHSAPTIATTWQCAMRQYTNFCGRGKPTKLDKACEEMQVVTRPNHSAVDDAMATWELIRAMALQHVAEAGAEPIYPAFVDINAVLGIDSPSPVATVGSGLFE